MDDRSITSDLTFVEQYTRRVPFKDPNEPGVASSWADFFFMGGTTPEELAGIYRDRAIAGGRLLPQQAMLLAFLQMLQTPRALLNTFPHTHRRLYYQQFLGLAERGAESAKVALSFEIAAGSEQVLLPENTLFPAGQDRHGAPIQYSLDRSLLANRSEWTDLRWCWCPSDAEAPIGLARSCIVFDKAQDKPWPEGGMRLFVPTPDDQTILTGRLVSGDLLAVPEGTFTFTLAASIDSALISQAQISGGDTWLPLTNNTPPGTTNMLRFQLSGGTGPAMPPLDLGGLTLEAPAIQINCKDQASLPPIASIAVNAAPAVTAGFDQYLLTPFGYGVQQEPVDETRLYLGFSGIRPGQSLSLFWELLGATMLHIEWQYLNALNTWVSLDATVVDRTTGLFRSGCWSAVLPSDASDTALSMPAGRFWVRARMDSAPTPDGTSNYPIVVGVLTNGMTATLLAPDTLDAETLSQPLAADTITYPIVSIPELTGTQQPWPSWGGRPQEATESFFERSAQRLSHRNRALTWQDMIELVKTSFPSVFGVVTPDSSNQRTLPAQHQQRLIVIPFTAEKDNADPLRPMLNEATLDDMATFLRRQSSPWQNIVVHNPRYRDVAIDYAIRFRPGVNPDYGHRQVREALERRYMPWAFGTLPAAILASRLDYYDVMAQIQEQPQVDHVISLTLDHGTHGIVGNDDEALILSWPADRPAE
ncbi:hypothetical protein [Pseudoxanthomonas sp. UTMC 1351]|uniref:hypothetical protein n=1 Tax=Pseudoxanthomonas sp. UTMC 1351 TaxID=2695853 RepID=UPI0034CD131E